ncbi:MAG TPA: hypothetical protein VK463_10065 [Desulfomonilaceae bacterium]|nr:hypothetical protein [Desulfomonilaceae bacterium]
MHEINLVDGLFIVFLAGTVPFLVKSILVSPRFTPSVRQWAIAGGILWMGYVVCSDWIADSVLGAPWMDAYYHDAVARNLLESIHRGDWSAFWDHFRIGNNAYHCYLSLLFYTGASIYTPTAINGWLAFWAGLILAYHFCATWPWPGNRHFLLFWTIFCPSVVFWCTVNLKESIMYWSVTNLFVASFVPAGHKYSPGRIVLTVVAIAAGILLRPHVLAGWVLAVAVIMILHRGRRLLAVVVMSSLPLVFAGVQDLAPVDLSLEATNVAETHFTNLQQIKAQGTRIEYKEEHPIFFVSGFVSAFFRPFPWTVGSGRMLASCCEIWTMTLLIFFAWYNLSMEERKFVLKLPMIQVAILGSLWMCALLTYYPNEGLMIRQRVQMVPGLLALAVLPSSIRYFNLAKKDWVKRSRLKGFHRESRSHAGGFLLGEESGRKRMWQD